MIKKQNLPDEEIRIKKNMKQGKDAIIYSALFVRIRNLKFLGKFLTLVLGNFGREKFASDLHMDRGQVQLRGNQQHLASGVPGRESEMVHDVPAWPPLPE